MSERSALLLLQDIVEAINNIFIFTNGYTLEMYIDDIKTKHAVEHNFMIVGEAVSRLPEDFKTEHSGIEWRKLKAFRNVVVHAYFGIDNSIVWDIIKDSLPDLLSQVNILIDNET